MNKDEIKKLEQINQRSKSNTKRLDEHDKKIDELNNVYVALTKVDSKVDKVTEDVSEMKTDLKEIKDKPSKRIDQIVGYLLSAIIGGIIGYLFLKIGLR